VPSSALDTNSVFSFINVRRTCLTFEATGSVISAASLKVHIHIYVGVSDKTVPALTRKPPP